MQTVSQIIHGTHVDELESALGYGLIHANGVQACFEAWWSTLRLVRGHSGKGKTTSLSGNGSAAGTV